MRHRPSWWWPPNPTHRARCRPPRWPTRRAPSASTQSPCRRSRPPSTTPSPPPRPRTSFSSPARFTSSARRGLGCAPVSDRTLVICKPDAVERGLAGEIIGRLEAKRLKLVAAELRVIDAETAGRHYAEHEGKPFYGDLVAFITRSPAMLLVVEGPEDTFRVVRTLMGVTNPP